MSVVGMTKAEIQSSLDIRVVIEDGVDLTMSCDYRPSRTNVIVENGVVVAIDGFY